MTPSEIEYILPTFPHSVAERLFSLCNEYNTDTFLLFGSRSRRGMATQWSDWDIAIQGGKEERFCIVLERDLLDVVICRDVEKWYNFVHGGIFVRVKNIHNSFIFEEKK